MQKFKLLISLFMFYFPNSLAFSTEINPFIPKIKEPSSGNIANEYIDPLKKWDAFNYDFIGVVLSSHRSLALLETPDGEIYTLSVGDNFGNKNNKIIEILIDRLVLSNNPKKQLILKNHKL